MICFEQFSKLSKVNNYSSSILAFLVIEKIQNLFACYTMKKKLCLIKIQSYIVFARIVYTTESESYDWDKTIYLEFYCTLVLPFPQDYRTVYSRLSKLTLPVHSTKFPSKYIIICGSCTIHILSSLHHSFNYYKEYYNHNLGAFLVA